MTPGRRIALGFWLTVTVGLSALYFARPDLIDPVNLVGALRRAGAFVMLGYVVVSVCVPSR